MVMPAWYDKLVEAKMHKVTQMSPEETAKEIAEIQGGAKSSFEGETVPGYLKTEQPLGELYMPVKKKRGRPLGSKNKPKEPK